MKEKPRLLHIKKTERTTWCTIKNKYDKVYTVGLKVLQTKYPELYQKYMEEYE